MKHANEGGLCSSNNDGSQKYTLDKHLVLFRKIVSHLFVDGFLDVGSEAGDVLLRDVRPQLQKTSQKTRNSPHGIDA